MKEQDIQAGNRLIVEFMEGKIIAQTSLLIQYEFPDGKLFNNQQLQYHTSWDWLMPVVEKIGKMYDPYKYKAFEEKEDAWEIVDLTLMNPINEVYDCVIKFIQWYNQQTPNPIDKK